MNTYKADLFCHTVKYFGICSWEREQLVNLGYDNPLDKAKSHKTNVADYYQNKENKHDQAVFLSTVTTSTDAIYSRKSLTFTLKDLQHMWLNTQHLRSLCCLSANCG